MEILYSVLYWGLLSLGSALPVILCYGLWMTLVARATAVAARKAEGVSLGTAPYVCKFIFFILFASATTFALVFLAIGGLASDPIDLMTQALMSMVPLIVGSCLGVSAVCMTRLLMD